MARIAFLNASGGAYSGRTMRERPLRGIQTGTILLAEALAARGHEVSVLNAIESVADEEGVQYRPVGAGSDQPVDLLVVNNNMREFDQDPGLAPGGRRVVWMRNPTNLLRLFKKGNLWPLLRHRPDGVFLSETHLAAVSRRVPFARRHLIAHGTDPLFLDTPQASEARPPRAVFFSQFYRGLDEMLTLWRERIHPACPTAEFHLCGDLKGRDASDFERRNIVAHGKMTKPALVALLRTTRVLLYNGHRDETFCNVVSEAYATGNAIVTRGLGVLGERVEDGVSGLIRRDDAALAAAAIDVLRDDALWQTLHRGALRHPSVAPWSVRAAEWEDRFLA